MFRHQGLGLSPKFWNQAVRKKRALRGGFSAIKSNYEAKCPDILPAQVSINSLTRPMVKFYPVTPLIFRDPHLPCTFRKAFFAFSCRFIKLCSHLPSVHLPLAPFPPQNMVHGGVCAVVK